MRACFACILGYLLCGVGLPAQESNTDVIIWEEGPSPANAFAYHAAAVYEGRIYVAGGINDGAFEMYDPKRRQWQSLPPVPTPRAFPSAAVLDGMFYLCGGLDSTDTSVDVVEVFNFNNHTWQTGPSMRERRSRFSLISDQVRLYAIGGIEVDIEGTYANLSSVEVYDTTTGDWQTITGMKAPRHGHGAVLIDRKILVTGGYTGSGQTGLTELYDPESNKWQILDSMPTPRGFFGCIAYGPYVYTIGGRIHSEEAPIERLSVVDNKWEALVPMPQPQQRFACVRADRNIYLIGGEDFPRQLLIGTFRE